jgi:uncharacterized protein
LDGKNESDRISLLLIHSTYETTKMVDNHIRPTYNEIHNIIARSSKEIASEFAPDLLIAIGIIIYVMRPLDLSLIFVQVEGSYEQLAPRRMLIIELRGFFPARVMRTFLKDPATKRNIPIHAIGLSLYESLPGTTEEQLGSEVIRTQWL